MTARTRWAVAGALSASLACTNNPYSDEVAGQKVLYTAFSEAHRTLDPAVAYNVDAHKVTGLVFDKLLEYHYLKRPYELIPGLAKAVPQAEPQPDGGVIYRFEMRPGVFYADDPCFELSGPGQTTREATAEDIRFELMRLADPALDVQVAEPFSKIAGFQELQARLRELREQPDFAKRPAREQYEAAGGLPGAVVHGRYGLEIRLREVYPQILYWLATEFSTPVAWEAVAYYDGNEGRERLADHPVGTGPYRIVHYDKQFRIVLVRNPRWYGIADPSAPGAHYPTEGAPGDAEDGLLDASVVGTPVPKVDRIEFRLEKETVAYFNKFLQGYYESAGIIKESFNQVIQNDRLTPEMQEMGIGLEKAVSPSVFYLGFNMEDATVGYPAGARARKLRQAMALAIDAEEWIELFLNGRGIPAQSPIPPGLFGYDPDYRDPYRQHDLAKAKQLLAEAGYANGIDPQTGKPLLITFDTYVVNSQSLIEREYFVNAWRKLGIDARLVATTYNEFQAKVERLAYQIYFWGWSADYPDPENFYFLLTCEMRRSTNGGPNSTNFCDPEFEKAFAVMKTRENDEVRMQAIREMRAVIERESPWIEIHHAVDYALTHSWYAQLKPFGMSYPMYKYYDVDVEARRAWRAERNQPLRWPAYAIVGALALATLPAIRTFFRERQ